jgi:uncharacterized protein (TIGR04255 family)
MNQENLKLPRAPLQEVVLDIKMNLDFDKNTNAFYDNEFESAAFQFSKLCSLDFNYTEIIKPSLIPTNTFLFRPTHRFRKIKDGYPLYQLGPGIFTVNQIGSEYTWIDFLELIIEGIDNLRKSYSKELTIQAIELRYVDVVAIDILEKIDKFNFLEKYLQIKAEGYPFIKGTLENINFTKSFKIDDITNLNINIATGVLQHTNKDSVLWQTSVNTNQPMKWDELINWIEHAHSIASSTFKEMINKKLYEYFSTDK